MELGAVGELQMWNRGANGRSHTKLPVLCTALQMRHLWFCGSRWWHCGLN